MVEHKTPKDMATLPALSPAEELVLQFTSLIHEPVTPEIIETCLQQLCPLLDPPSSPWPSSFIPLLRSLQDQGMITWTCQCHNDLLEPLTRQALTTGRLNQMAAIIRKILPISGEPASRMAKKSHRLLREIRLDLYSGNIEAMETALIRYYECPDVSDHESPLVNILGNPFEPHIFHNLPPHIRLHVLHQLSTRAYLNLLSFDRPLAYLGDNKTMASIPEAGRGSLFYLQTTNHLLRDNIEEATEVLKEAGPLLDRSGIRGWLAFNQQNYPKALACFKDDIPAKPKEPFFIGPEGLFYLLTLLQAGKPSYFPLITEYIKTMEEHHPHNPLLPCHQIIGEIIRAQCNQQPHGHIFAVWQQQPDNSLCLLFMALAHYWLNGRLSKSQLSQIQEQNHLARQNGYKWLNRQFDHLYLFGQQEPTGNKSALPPDSLLSIFCLDAPWQRALHALDLISIGGDPGKRDAPRRLIWLIHYKNGFITLTPKEQKLNLNGNWSKGRKISLKRLYQGTDLDFISKQDKNICATIIKTHRRGNDSFSFAMNKTLPALIGHPFLFQEDQPARSVEFIKGEPELQVRNDPDHFHLSINPAIQEDQTHISQENAGRYKIIQVTSQQQEIAKIIGSHGIRLPHQAEPRLLQSLGRLSSCLTVHSDLDIEDQNIILSEPDNRLYVQLQPVGPGLRLIMVLKPLGPDGPQVLPGAGSNTIITKVGQQRRQTRRDLDLENRLAQQIEHQCPTLQEFSDQTWEWLFTDPEECLQVLLELKDLEDLIVEWPEGGKMMVRAQANFNNLHLHIHKKRNWFTVDGKIEVDPDTVFPLRQLLQYIQNNNSRFVPMGQGEFLALSREFKEKLDELNLFSRTDDQNPLIHPLTSHIMEDFANQGAVLNLDQHWQQQRKKIKEARNLQPNIPPGLKAKLRDYQIEGFQWLVRLAHWGMGACLADDMGLGKTIQAITLILTRSNKGPTLVIAPTSVCHNWQYEINKFAPDLKPIIFSGKNRRQLVSSLSENDVLITSYALLQQEAELLASRNWQTIILDEAQAIKNLSTKRSRAAMALEGEFKVITTGTPIENHLGELWTLFNFINPGLLGNRENFNKKFATPIEKDQDQRCLNRLKKLIQPFILRRLKHEVLAELPPRTEVVMWVDMNKEEKALYEALRQNAIERINSSTATTGKKHIQVLAEIMKLRRSCCHPSLIAPDQEIESSKLNLFGKIITELIENEHRALVFSQFVSYLQIIREYLDQQGISYQYLDGSTPARKRREQVDAFQTGDKDLFLISLKAGGTGLNLTAATYVIHMDPWWNPAVEDQASDRAHRIGQHHPLTVYRLATRNSIEEKILAMHKEKRKIANSLLAGSDGGHKLTADELLKLLTS